jgi:chitodextrinase
VSCTGNPSVPTNLSVTGTTASSITLGWTASTPAASCTMQGYKIFRNGTLVTTSPTTSFSDTGLTPGTTYSYTIAAVDTSGHTSAQTAAVSGSASNDAVAPTTPTGLKTTLIGSNSIALSWTASTDNTAVTGYDVFRNGTKVGSPTVTAYTDNALTPNTTYSYTVKARDAAGNTSAASTALSAKTLAGTAANTGDLNSDGKVNITDLSIMLSHWNSTGVPVSQGDVNADGKVNLTDLSILLSHWG